MAKLNVRLMITASFHGRIAEVYTGLSHLNMTSAELGGAEKQF